MEIVSNKKRRSYEVTKQHWSNGKDIKLDGVLLKPVTLCRNCDNLDKDISYCKELNKVIDDWSFYCANGIPKNK